MEVAGQVDDVPLVLAEHPVEPRGAQRLLEATDVAPVPLDGQPVRHVAETGRGIAPWGGPPPGHGARGVARGCERRGRGKERGAEESTPRGHKGLARGEVVHEPPLRYTARARCATKAP